MINDYKFQTDTSGGKPIKRLIGRPMHILAALGIGISLYAALEYRQMEKGSQKSIQSVGAPARESIKIAKFLCGCIMIDPRNTIVYLKNLFNAKIKSVRITISNISVIEYNFQKVVGDGRRRRVHCSTVSEHMSGENI